jgi:peptidoglycan-associated lipoprotein
MKLTKFGYLLTIGLTLGLGAVGCKHHPQGVTVLPGSRAGGVGEPGTGNPLGNGPGTEANPSSTGGTPMGDPAEWANATRDEKKFEADTVHFEYDSSAVKSSEKSKVADVADSLKGNPGTGVEIEGHCDERGTDQYNYSLGERRALALREELIGLGVDGSRVLTKSFGRSRPVDTGHSEASHAKNRRGVFILLTK